MDLSKSASLAPDSAGAVRTKTVVNLVALFLIIAGTVFKKMYWAGADVILLTATLALLVTLFFTYQDLEKTTRNGMVARLLTALLFFLIISAAFSRFHWNGAESLVTVAVLLTLLSAFFLIIMQDELPLPRQFAITFLLYLIYIVGAISFLSHKAEAILNQALQNQ